MLRRDLPDRLAPARRLGVAAAAVLVLTPAAALAHGTIAPTPAPSGSTRFVISVPNESVNVVITGFKLTAPAGVTIEEAESEFGFQGSWTATGAEWGEGSIGPPDTAQFAFTAVIPEGVERVVFQGEELYGAIESGRFPLTVRIDGAAAAPAADDPEDGSADRTVLWVVGLGLIVLTASAAFLFAARRRTR